MDARALNEERLGAAEGSAQRAPAERAEDARGGRRALCRRAARLDGRAGGRHGRHGERGAREASAKRRGERLLRLPGRRTPVGRDAQGHVQHLLVERQFRLSEQTRVLHFFSRGGSDKL